MALFSPSPFLASTNFSHPPRLLKNLFTPPPPFHFCARGNCHSSLSEYSIPLPRKRRVRKTGRASRSLNAFNRQKFFSSLLKGRWLHKSQYTDAFMHLKRTRSDACFLQGNKWEAPFFGGNSEHPSRNTQNRLFSAENSAGVHARARATKIKVTGLEMAQKVRLGRKLFFLRLFRLGSEWRVANFGFPPGE